MAATFLVTVLVGIGSVLGTQMLSVTSSTTWKVATALLDQAMEEVRALPDSTLATGLSDLQSCDPSVPGAPSPDPDILVNGSIWTFAPNGETIPHGDLSCTPQIPPLVPHESVASLNNVPFTVAVYPTIPSGMPSGMMRVTAIVSWKRIGLVGVHSVSAQTLVCATLCATGNNVYSSPVQPLSSAGAEVNVGGTVQVTGTVAGLTFDQFLATPAQAYTSMQIQQISTVHGCATTPGGQIVVSGAVQGSAGELEACSAADNDPGSSNSSWRTNCTGAQAGGSLPLAGTLLDTLGLDLSGGDTACTTSTVDASATPPAGYQPCTDLAGVTQVTGLPCGHSSVSKAGSRTLSVGTVSSLLGSLGDAPLFSVAASSAPASSFVGRYTASGSSASYCDTPATTSGDGCVHAGASRSFGLVELAGIPNELLGPGVGNGLLAAPPAWGGGSANCPVGNYLVALVGYSDSASAESGIAAAAPSTGSGGTPYLCYWNGSGYSSTSAVLGPTSPSLSINSSSYTFANAADTVAVSISSHLFLGTATTTTSPSLWAANSASACWQSPCTASATVTSPIQGSFNMTVSAVNAVGGPLVQLADLTVQVNLGELTASTSYQSAPPQP